MNLEESFELFEECVRAGGPKSGDYQNILSALEVIHRDEHAGGASLTEKKDAVSRLDRVLDRYPEVFRSRETLQGFAWSKPRGYAGDFQMISLIYENHVSNADRYQRWDEFFQAGHAPHAVRNRADFLLGVLKGKSIDSLASIGSGPAYDVERALKEHDEIRHVVLVDNDREALNFSRVNLERESRAREISFVHRNALRWRPDRKFDFIWCSGLFDYLNDKTAVFLLKRLRLAIEAGGRIAIGNFGQFNPSRAYMESIGRWYLIHRSADDMAALAVLAGFDHADVEVCSDETGVNLFLLAECP